MLPTYTHIEALHKKYAPDKLAYDLIFTHCLIVRDIIEGLLQQNPQLNIDKDLAYAGALLHDIGAYGLYKDGWFENDYITHGIRGSKILGNEGLDNRLVRIASHHTGVGLSRQDIVTQGLPLPDKDFQAETIEERLVMYADKFHSKHPRFNTYESYTKTVSKFGDGKADMFRKLKDEFGLPALAPLVRKYGHPIV